MQAGQLTIANSNAQQISVRSFLAKIAGLITRLLGCWHREMSRPFSHNGQAYRSCLTCGAQRRFNLKDWQMHGDYYFSRPQVRQLQVLTRLSAVKKAA